MCDGVERLSAGAPVIPGCRLAGESPGAWLYEVRQGSEEWLRAREGAVGGTRICGLLGESRYCSPAQAVMGMVGEVGLQPTKAMARGTAAEPLLRRELGRQLGVEFREIGIAVSRRYPWMRASPDGVYDLPGGGLGLLEMKVVSSAARGGPMMAGVRGLRAGEAAGGVLPPILPEHWHQVQYTAGVLGAREITYCVVLWPEYGQGQETGGLLVRRFAADPALFEGVYAPRAAAALRAAAEARGGAPQNGDAVRHGAGNGAPPPRAGAPAADGAGAPGAGAHP